MAQLFTGQVMPLVGLGTWKSKPGEVQAAVETALKLGYKHIDCAAIYGNEKEIGTALKTSFDGGVVKREDLFVTSKLWNTKHAKEDVKPSLVKTLEDLGLTYLDLYLVHWPIGFKAGDVPFPKDEAGTLLYSDTHFMETWGAMEQLVDEGLVRAIGVSNFNSKQLAQVLAESRIKPAVLQIESHLYFTQEPLIEFAQSKGVVVTAYSPLGSPDRPWAKPDDPKLLTDPLLNAIAAKYNKSAAQTAIHFQVQRGVVTIPKSVSEHRLKENLDVFGFELGAEDLAALKGLNRNWRGCVPTVVPLIPQVNGADVPRDVKHPYFPFLEPF